MEGRLLVGSHGRPRGGGVINEVARGLVDLKLKLSCSETIDLEAWNIFLTGN